MSMHELSQRAPTERQQRVLSGISRRDRFRGCLLGGAVGDALGAPVEFDSLQDIRTRFGTRGIQDFVPSYGKLGAITDDTQMTMFVAEGCRRARRHGNAQTHLEAMPEIEAAHYRWLMTQSEKPAKPQNAADSDRGLLANKAMHTRRAPGNTCLGALLTGCPITQSKGCGGVMRVAPIGLCFTPSEAFDLGCRVAGITHGHPTGKRAAGAFAELISRLLRDEALEVAAIVIAERLLGGVQNDETGTLLTRAIDLSRDTTDSDSAILTLGEGWIAEEALAISLYCALSSPDLEEAVIKAVNHGGDSDSTGSICGQIMGVISGADPIPDRWLEQVELRKDLEKLAVGLCDNSSLPTIST